MQKQAEPECSASYLRHVTHLPEPPLPRGAGVGRGLSIYSLGRYLQIDFGIGLIS